MDKALEARLRLAADRSEIWQVVQRLARALDRLDDDLARSCYHDDAIDDHSQYVGGPEGFLAYARVATGGFVNQQHCVLNHVCDVEGDEAWSETYYVFWGDAVEPPHFESRGRYIDYFQRRNDEWRIKTRATSVEKCFDLMDSSQFPSVQVAERGEDDVPIARDRSDVSYQRPLRTRAPRDPLAGRE